MVLSVAHRRRNAKAGFSLLEVTLALSIGGLMMGALWQIMSTSGQSRDAATLAGQASTVSVAAQQYINARRNTLLALPGLGSLNSVIRVKVTDSDVGATSDSLLSAGYLPANFVNANAAGQSYALFVRREDGGVIGVIDAADRLAGLIITTGGSLINDQTAARAVSAMGPAGGFLYAQDNPAPPLAATTARGAYGGWQVDLTTAGWNTIGSVAQAGRFALLTNMAPPTTAGINSAARGQSVTRIDDFSDAVTDYLVRYNLFMGANVAPSYTSGTHTTAIGVGAMLDMQSSTSPSNNTALGRNAMSGYGTATGINSVAVGSGALDDMNTGSNNVGIGVGALGTLQSGTDMTAVGHNAGYNCWPSSSSTLVGSWAGSGSGGCSGGENVYIGTSVGRYTSRNRNVLAGAYAGSTSADTGNFNVGLGYQVFRNVATDGNSNTAAGYRAAANLTTADDTIVLGSGVNAPSATASNRINIGNLIVGDRVTNQVEIGDPALALTTGISFDVGARTDSARLPVGTTAQRPICDMTRIGAQRYNTTLSAIEFCNGGEWLQLLSPTPPADPPTVPTLIGYFVMTSGTWNGNLGGVQGANTLCYNDLLANDWMGKATAVANGQLNPTNVRAFICGPGQYTGACNNATPNGTYQFARSGDVGVGGASFTANSSGFGPNNSVAWAGATYFNTSQRYWSGRTSTSASIWADGDVAWAAFGGDSCAYYTSSSAARFSAFGDPTTSNAGRWQSGGYGWGRTCNQTAALVCFVHPLP
jgi:hypothetical protein